MRAGVSETVGVSNTTSARVSLPYESIPSTINIILLQDSKLTRSSMLNANVTVIEAKSDVLS